MEHTVHYTVERKFSAKRSAAEFVRRMILAHIQKELRERDREK